MSVTPSSARASAQPPPPACFTYAGGESGRVIPVTAGAFRKHVTDRYFEGSTAIVENFEIEGSIDAARAVGQFTVKVRAERRDGTLLGALTPQGETVWIRLRPDGNRIASLEASWEAPAARCTHRPAFWSFSYAGGESAASFQLPPERSAST